MMSRVQIASIVVLTLAGCSFLASSSYGQRSEPVEPPGGVKQHVSNVDAEPAIMGMGYHSQKLQADLELYRYYFSPGFSFFAAKVVSMDPASPLRQIGFRLGDFITRLDNVKIAEGRYWVEMEDQHYWMLPETERHYGHTEVRFVRDGALNAENVMIDLGPAFWAHPVQGPGGFPTP